MTSTDESPPKYKLELDRNGWKCTSQHFRVVSNVIKIKNSDAEADITPSEQQRHKTVDHLGNFSQHKQQYRTDPLFQLWMNKIGPYLADWVLDKRASNDRAWPFLFSFMSMLMLNVNENSHGVDDTLETHRFPRELHALGPHYGRPHRPCEPTHRRVSLRRAQQDLPLANGVRRARHMAHERRWQRQRRRR